MENITRYEARLISEGDSEGLGVNEIVLNWTEWSQLQDVEGIIEGDDFDEVSRRAVAVWKRLGLKNISLVIAKIDVIYLAPKPPHKASGACKIEDFADWLTKNCDMVASEADVPKEDVYDIVEKLNLLLDEKHEPKDSAN